MIVDASTPGGSALLGQAVATFRGAEVIDDGFLKMAGSVAFLAVDADTVVGWCWGYLLPRPDGAAMAYMHELEVAIARRREGIGRDLLRSFAKAVADRGASKMFLTTGTSNRAARALYDSLGGGLAAQGPTVNYWFQVPLP